MRIFKLETSIFESENGAKVEKLFRHPVNGVDNFFHSSSGICPYCLRCIACCIQEGVLNACEAVFT